MDLYTHFTQEYRREFIASRLESCQRYRYGTGSPLVAMIGGLASGLRRIAGRIEAWAKGTADSNTAHGLPHVPAR